MTAPRLLGSIGDINPIEYGGGYIVTDDDTPEGWIEYCHGIETLGDSGELPDRMKAWEIELDNPDHRARVRVRVYRVTLERLKRYTDDDDDTTYVVPLAFDAATWPKHASAYREWYLRDIASVAESCGTTVRDMIDRLCSENPCERASAFQDIASHWDWKRFDDSPMDLSLGDLIERWEAYA